MLKFKTQDFEAADDMTNLWVYNGLDTCLTFEIIEKLRPLFNDNTRAIYKWEFSAQAIALEMMFRGFRVDREQVHKIIEEAQIEYDHFLAMLNQMAEAVWDAPLNPNLRNSSMKLLA